MSAPLDYSDAIALIQVYFSALGIGWDSEPTQLWLQKNGAKTREDLTLADLADLQNYLKRAWDKRSTTQIFVNSIRHKFHQWEQMMVDGRTSPNSFAHEIATQMEQYRDFPEVQTEIRRLIAERRNAA